MFQNASYVATNDRFHQKLALHGCTGAPPGQSLLMFLPNPSHKNGYVTKKPHKLCVTEYH